MHLNEHEWFWEAWKRENFGNPFVIEAVGPKVKRFIMISEEGKNARWLWMIAMKTFFN